MVTTAACLTVLLGRPTRMQGGAAEQQVDPGACLRQWWAQQAAPCRVVRVRWIVMGDHMPHVPHALHTCRQGPIDQCTCMPPPSLIFLYAVAPMMPPASVVLAARPRRCRVHSPYLLPGSLDTTGKSLRLNMTTERYAKHVVLTHTPARAPCLPDPHGDLHMTLMTRRSTGRRVSTKTHASPPGSGVEGTRRPKVSDTGNSRSLGGWSGNLCNTPYTHTDTLAHKHTNTPRLNLACFTVKTAFLPLCLSLSRSSFSLLPYIMFHINNVKLH